MKLFLIGQVVGVSWEFQGIVDNEEDASLACIDRNYFYAPIIVGEIIQHDTAFFPNIVYPKVT